MADKKNFLLQMRPAASVITSWRTVGMAVYLCGNGYTTGYILVPDNGVACCRWRGLEKPADKDLRSRPVEKFIRGIRNGSAGIIIHRSWRIITRHSRLAFSFRRAKIVFHRRTHQSLKERFAEFVLRLVEGKLDSFRFFILYRSR